MTDTPGKRFDGTSLGDDAAAAQHGERSAGIGYAGHDADLGLKDKKSWSEPDLSALRCEKVWFKVVGGQL